MDNNRINELVKVAVDALQEKKARDLRILDIRNVTVIADYFIIASGDTVRQVAALCDFVDDKLYEHGFERKSMEGYNTNQWVLMDYSDVVIHIFNKEDRAFYDLERIWGDAKEVDPADLDK